LLVRENKTWWEDAYYVKFDVEVEALRPEKERLQKNMAECY